MIVISRISCSCSRDKASALFEEMAAMLSARSISRRAVYARLVARKSRRMAASSPASIVTGELSCRFFGRFLFFIFRRRVSAAAPFVDGQKLPWRGKDYNLPFRRAIFAFDQRGTTLHPIPTVVIGDGVELPDRRAVDVPAEDSIYRKFLRITHDLFFEPGDKADCVFYTLFRIGAERPITEAESAAHEIDEGIQREQKLVANVACEREPFHVLYHRVELMAVNDEHALAIRQAMNGMFLHGDVAVGAVELGKQIVVIARDVNDPCAFARLAQNLLNDVVMLLRPINPAPQLPDVDQITDNVERLEFVFAQKIEQRAGVGTAGAQMHV